MSDVLQGTPTFFVPHSQTSALSVVWLFVFVAGYEAGYEIFLCLFFVCFVFFRAQALVLCAYSAAVCSFRASIRGFRGARRAGGVRCRFCLGMHQLAIRIFLLCFVFSYFCFSFSVLGSRTYDAVQVVEPWGEKSCCLPFFLVFYEGFSRFFFCFFSSDCLAKCHVLVSCGEHRYVVQYRGCGVGAEFVDRWCMLDFFVCVCFPLFFVVIWR